MSKREKAISRLLDEGEDLSEDNIRRMQETIDPSPNLDDSLSGLKEIGAKLDNLIAAVSKGFHVKIPDIEIPEIRIPDIKIPEQAAAPELKEISTKLDALITSVDRGHQINISEIKVPELKMPEFKYPDPPPVQSAKRSFQLDITRDANGNIISAKATEE